MPPRSSVLGSRLKETPGPAATTASWPRRRLRRNDVQIPASIHATATATMAARGLSTRSAQLAQIVPIAAPPRSSAPCSRLLLRPAAQTRASTRMTASATTADLAQSIMLASSTQIVQTAASRAQGASLRPRLRLLRHRVAMTGACTRATATAMTAGLAQSTLSASWTAIAPIAEGRAVFRPRPRFWHRLLRPAVITRAFTLPTAIAMTAGLAQSLISARWAVIAPIAARHPRLRLRPRRLRRSVTSRSI